MRTTSRRLRRVLVACLAVGVAVLAGCDAPAAPATGSTGSVTPTARPAPATTAAPTTTAPTTTPPPVEAQLPRGGRKLFPRYRLVGYAGSPGAPALGRLGVGALGDRVRELDSRAVQFGDGRTPQPVLELIATVVQGSPGRDGKWRTRLPDDVIAKYLSAARSDRAILLLGIQPGRSTFLDEAKAYATWLRQPDVGLALDPEWAMAPGEVPMHSFGHTTGPDINLVTAWLAGLVSLGRLPDKAVVIHQLAPAILRDESAIRQRPGVVVVKSVDGIGSRAMKEDTWRELTRSMPRTLRAGFKLFFEEDRKFGPLMTPAQVLALKPAVDYVLYE